MYTHLDHLLLNQSSHEDASMITLVSRPGSRRLPEALTPDCEETRLHVRGLLAGTAPLHALSERRRDQRFPFPRLCVVTPVEADGRTSAGPAVTAAGKHLSETGLSFFHPEPLPHRWVIASLQKNDGTWLGFLMDLDWCRFTRQGWYESGGRFLRLVPSPLEVVEQS